MPQHHGPGIPLARRNITAPADFGMAPQWIAPGMVLREVDPSAIDQPTGDPAPFSRPMRPGFYALRRPVADPPAPFYALRADGTPESPGNGTIGPQRGPYLVGPWGWIPPHYEPAPPGTIPGEMVPGRWELFCLASSIPPRPSGPPPVPADLPGADPWIWVPAAPAIPATAAKLPRGVAREQAVVVVEEGLDGRPAFRATWERDPLGSDAPPPAPKVDASLFVIADHITAYEGQRFAAPRVEGVPARAPTAEELDAYRRGILAGMIDRLGLVPHRPGCSFSFGFALESPDAIATPQSTSAEWFRPPTRLYQSGALDPVPPLPVPPRQVRVPWCVKLRDGGVQLASDVGAVVSLTGMTPAAILRAAIGESRRVIPWSL